MQRCITRLVLAQLAVLAAAAVVAGKVGAVPIVTLLAGDAKAHPGYCGLARLRYGGTTGLTLAEGLTLRQASLGPTYAVLDGRVDLLVDRVVSGPASSHIELLKEGSVCREMVVVANGGFSSQTCLQSLDRAEHREGRFDVCHFVRRHSTVTQCIDVFATQTNCEH